MFRLVQCRVLYVVQSTVYNVVHKKSVLEFEILSLARGLHEFRAAVLGRLSCPSHLLLVVHDVLETFFRKLTREHFLLDHGGRNEAAAPRYVKDSGMWHSGMERVQNEMVVKKMRYQSSRMG